VGDVCVVVFVEVVVVVVVAAAVVQAEAEVVGFMFPMHHHLVAVVENRQ